MDNFSLQMLALHCNHLTDFFHGVWSAHNFPSMCNDNEEDGKALFQIVNTEPSYLPENTGLYLVVKKNSLRPLAKKIRALYFGIVWKTKRKLIKDCTQE